LKKIHYLFLAAAIIMFSSCGSNNPTANVYQMMFQYGNFPYFSYDGAADAYIDNQNATTNFGPSSTINAFYWAGYTQRALVKFDLTSITPPNVTVVNAYLTLVVAATSGAVTAVAAYKIISPWQENYATWIAADYLNSWANQGGDFDAAPASDIITPSTSYVTLTLKNSLVQGWLAHPSQNYGVIIRCGNEGGVDGGIQFYTKEYSEALQRPKLTVYYKLP
jgi:hypothetical protein